MWNANEGLLRRHGAALSIAFAFGLLLSEAARAESSSIIWERGDQLVRLASQDDPSAPPNDHPVSRSSDEIAAMLDRLQLRYVDEVSDAPPVPVFTREEIATLSEAIAIGLDRATPSQDIIFHTIGARALSRGAFLRRNRVNAGRVFYRDGNLNIIFGQVQTPHRKKNLYGQIDQDFYPRNYGSRTDAADHEVVLLANDSVRHYRDNAGTREDWIVLDPSMARGEVADTAAAKAPPPSGQSTAATVERPAAPRSPEAPVAGAAIAAGPADETPASIPPAPTADIEQRLEALKRLRERNLITEEAYQAKMKEILEEL